MRFHIAASNIAHKEGWDRHFSGWVVSPAYAWWSKRINDIESHWPIIVDNGAWSDHQVNRSREALEIWERTKRTAELCNWSNIQFINLPDCVGSWRRTEQLLDDTYMFLEDEFFIAEDTSFKRSIDKPLGIVLQDNFSVTKVEEYLELFTRVVNNKEIKPWIFVGGSSWNFKQSAVTIARNYWPEYKVHVGKVSKIPELVFCQKMGVDSVDTSTFSRPPTDTYRRTLTQRLEHWEAWNNGDQTILTDWVDIL